MKLECGCIMEEYEDTGKVIFRNICGKHKNKGYVYLALQYEEMLKKEKNE